MMLLPVKDVLLNRGSKAEQHEYTKREAVRDYPEAAPEASMAVEMGAKARQQERRDKDARDKQQRQEGWAKAQ